MALEPFEKSLAMPAVFLDTGIPHIPRPHQPFCLPNENERSPGWQPDRFHRLQVPYFRTGETNGFIRLPFRASGEYPEVEEAFRQLHQLYETKVCEAYAQPPLKPGTAWISAVRPGSRWQPGSPPSVFWPSLINLGKTNFFIKTT